MVRPIKDYHKATLASHRNLKPSASKLSRTAVFDAALQGRPLHLPAVTISSPSISPRLLLEGLVKVAHAAWEAELQHHEDKVNSGSNVDTHHKDDIRLRLRPRPDLANADNRPVSDKKTARKEKNLTCMSRKKMALEINDSSHRRPNPRKNMPEAFRKIYLSQHPLVVYFSQNRITCAHCMMNYKLDGRNEYYPGFALKHFKRCKEGKGSANRLANGSEYPEGPIYRGGYSGEILDAHLRLIKRKEAEIYVPETSEIERLKLSKLNPFCARYYAESVDATCTCEVHLNNKTFVHI